MNKRCLQTPAQAIEAEFASEAKQIVAESAVFAGGVQPWLSTPCGRNIGASAAAACALLGRALPYLPPTLRLAQSGAALKSAVRFSKLPAFAAAVCAMRSLIGSRGLRPA